MRLDDEKSHLVLSPWQHSLSTVALCFVAFTHSYLLISVFPYSGFMAMELVSGATSENAGSYAGLIASAFMAGRSLSSIAWGQLADTYGRIVVLHLSLLLSAVFSLLFGWTRSFALALLWRFLMGMSNGMILVTKTAVSELAGGNRDLEQNTMNVVMSMWGAAFLFAPALSGFVAEPVRQYPNVSWLQTGGLGQFLTEFPFFGPNIVGAVLCVASIGLCRWTVPETLPDRRRRHAKHLPGDAVSTIRRLYRSVLPPVAEEEGTDEEVTPVLQRLQADKESGSYGSGEPTSGATTLPIVAGGGYDYDYDSDEDDESSFELPPDLLHFVQDDVDDAIRESQLFGDDAASVLNTNRARRSLVAGVAKRSSVTEVRRRSRIASPASVPSETDRRGSGVSGASHAKPSLAEIWSNAQVRRHMVVYWIASFIMVAQDEGFPLFCLSVDAGLGLKENGIGSILSSSGFLFLAIQLVLYAPFVARTGLYGSMRWSTAALPLLAAVIPLSLLLNRGEQIQGRISWQAFGFLVTDLALARVFGMTFMSGITVAMNRLVPPSQRATLNGFGALGGSFCKSIGPAFAGLLVAFSFSSGLFSPHGGAVFLFLIIGGVNVITTVAAFYFLHEEVGDED